MLQNLKVGLKIQQTTGLTNSSNGLAWRLAEQERITNHGRYFGHQCCAC